MSVFEHVVNVPLAGATGNANSESPARGELESISLEYSGQGAGCVVTVSEVGGFNRQLLTITGNTNIVLPVRVQARDPAGALVAGLYVPWVNPGFTVNVSISSGAAGSVKARCIYRDYL